MQAAGIVQIASLGTYQITFGVSISGNVASTFQLRVNGVSPPPSQQIADFIQAGGAMYLTAQTILVRITVNPSTLTLVNTSGANRNLNNASGLATGGPVAYMTIVKLQ